MDHPQLLPLPHRADCWLRARAERCRRGRGEPDRLPGARSHQAQPSRTVGGTFRPQVSEQMVLPAASNTVTLVSMCGSSMRPGLRDLHAEDVEDPVPSLDGALGHRTKRTDQLGVPIRATESERPHELSRIAEFPCCRSSKFPMSPGTPMVG